MELTHGYRMVDLLAVAVVFRVGHCRAPLGVIRLQLGDLYRFRRRGIRHLSDPVSPRQGAHGTRARISCGNLTPDIAILGLPVPEGLPRNAGGLAGDVNTISVSDALADGVYDGEAFVVRVLGDCQAESAWKWVWSYPEWVDRRDTVGRVTI